MIEVLNIIGWIIQILASLISKNLSDNKMSVIEHEDINRMIVEYLKSNGMSKVADSMIN